MEKNIDIMERLCDLECTSITVSEIAGALKRDYFEVIPIDTIDKERFVSNFKTMNEFINVICEYSEKIKESSYGISTDYLREKNDIAKTPKASVTKDPCGMSIEDLPYVVDKFKTINTLVYDALERYFYDLRGEEKFVGCFNYIKADLEALHALCEQTSEILLKIARNTEGVVLDD